LQQREADKAQRDADQAEAISAKAVERAEKKQIKTEKQLATVAAERAQAVSKAVFQAHTATLFETQAACHPQGEQPSPLLIYF